MPKDDLGGGSSINRLAKRKKKAQTEVGWYKRRDVNVRKKRY